MGRGRPPQCVHCGSTDSISKGVRRTKTMGERRLRVCKGCGRKFTPRHQVMRAESAAPQPGEAQSPDEAAGTP